MYSVEDLLISHGYKAPRNAPSSRELQQQHQRHADRRRDAAEGRASGHGTANGYETDVGAYVCARQAAVAAAGKGYSSDGECRERAQRRKPGGSNHGDAQPLGDPLTRDSGFYDGARGMYTQPRGERDVSYWRRRGQDFSVLLDYADCREPRGSSFVRPPDGVRRAQERQYWDEREKGYWRAAGDRRCQSLGPEGWRPTASLGRQLSDCEGERRGQEQRHIGVPEGPVDPRTKGKSLSLPRVLSPESLQYVDVSAVGQSAFAGQRINGSLPHGPPGRYHSEGCGRGWWGENGWPAAPGGHSAPLPKPRFSRPLKPPSYEAHQQTWGSSEMLAGDHGLQPKDRSPYAPRQDYFAHEPAGSGVEPPVYIPPPSYERPLLQRAPQKNYADVSDYRLKGVPFQQVPRSVESGKWFFRPTGCTWAEHQRDRRVPCRRPSRPGLSPDGQGWVQYLPFDDPRVRHISGGALTDADKIRHISQEFPDAKVLEQSTDDSAFPPAEGPCVNTEPSKRSLNEPDDGNRGYSGLHKDSDGSVASDQSGNVPQLQKDLAHTVLQTTPSGQSPNSGRGLSETVTQVKKIEPGVDGDGKKSSKRRLNETIFCLVSVPLHLQPNGDSFDQNNNEKLAGAEETSAGSNANLPNQQTLNTSLTDLELETLTRDATNGRHPKKATPTTVREELQPLRLNDQQELHSPGAWPGDQYRDRETQTSRPEGTKGTPQGLPDPQALEQGRSTSNATPDSGAGADCSTYGYPIKGQKKLHPSSNSAFSRTAIFSSQLKKSAAQPPPSGKPEEPAYLSARRSESRPPPGNAPEAFGQFLLKPVSRRPWDAIEELESFNKELQAQIGKRSSVDQCIEDLDKAYLDILELSAAGGNDESHKTQDSDYKKESRHRAEEPIKKPDKAQRAFEGWAVGADPDRGEVKSAFSRPPGRTASLGKQPNEPIFRDYSLQSEIPQASAGDYGASKTDIPVLKESLLRDVGLTVYTETPGGTRHPMQDASTLTSPPNYEDVCHSLHLSRERAAPDEHKSGNVGTASHSSFRTFGLSSASRQEASSSRADTERKVRKENLVSRLEETNTDAPASKTQNSRFWSRGVHSVASADEGTNRSAFDEDDEPDHFDWRKQLSLAEKDLEALLISEKANSLPPEDLSNLYEVKCAEGIPEKESIEERAARILGIEVPPESLAVGDQKAGSDGATDPDEATESDPGRTEEPPESSAKGEISQVQSRYEEVSVESIDPNGPEQEAEEEVMESGGDGGLSAVTEGNDAEQQVEQDPVQPEVLPDEPLLPVPTTANEQSLSGDENGHNDPQAAEAPRDEAAASPCQVEVEHLVQVVEAEPESHTIRFSAQSFDSEEEVEGEGEGEVGRDAEDEVTPARQPSPTHTLSLASQPPPRNATVAKREITLPPDFSDSSLEADLLDEEVPPFSDSYDPSRVERV
ncbi:hypothetical protein MATL_G00023830 [Megalops atlanticus]|uniref:Junctional protein associated with coronary artery disease n=1 Tax=Megalops atlanticus TaxID=7932 RepID=A0A9D3QH62_MEGAT|nr:hypothetical protein MATL_G00023830 [Megalops atlanticus]